MSRIRILHLEDSPGDALLVSSTLEADDLDCEITRVDSRGEFVALLDGGELDLVLSDYALPGFDGISALRVVREKNPDLPFVFVSGTMGEELAIETLKAGATDYVLKDRMPRLAPAVRRALEESRVNAERRRALEALHESRARFQAVIASALDAIVVMDRRGVIIDWNPQAEAIFGWPAGEAIGRQLADTIIPPRYREAHRAGLKRYFETGEASILNRRLELSALHRDGREFPVELAISASKSEKGSTFSAFLRDITERIRSERALRESEERYRSIVETTNDWIWAMNTEGRITYNNRTVEAILGYTPAELADADSFQLIHEEDVPKAREFLAEAVRRKQGWSGLSLRWRHKGGGYRHLESNAVPVFGERGEVVEFRRASRDVSERIQLEAQLRQSQKMEAIGRLAGGIAHDFNNLLTTILGYSELILQEMGEKDPLREDLMEIRKSGERAAVLTRQLLAFSRKQVLQPVVLDVNRVVTELEKMLRRLIGEDVEFVLSLGAGLDSVKADPGQLEQIIVNLVVNSRDAMPAGGRLTIETASHEAIAETPEHPGLATGPYVRLSVSDTGIGMDSATQSQIFEPFFTTKEKGKGTGLGLSTVYGIVKQSDGYISVASEPGRGARFEIYLPAVSSSGEQSERRRDSSTPSGDETILLVEDEQPLRALARRALEARGYKVVEASSAENALTLTANYPDAIDLMVTDAVMPGASGPELARILARSRPAMKVLFVSGFTDDAVVRSGELSPAQAFLQKPFTADVLQHAVREVLDRAAPAGENSAHRNRRLA